MKKPMSLCLSILLLCALLASCAAPQGSDTPKDEGKPEAPLSTIVFTEPVRDYHWAPAYLAETLGYFAESGLQADFQTVSGADASAPVFAGEAQFGLRGVEMALMSAAAGQHCKILFSTSARYPYQLIGASADYATVASLRGGIIGGGKGPTSGPQAFVNAILRDAAVEAEVINMLSAGYLAAIKNGEIQAAVATNPWISKILLEQGGALIVDGANKDSMQALIGSDSYELFMVFATDQYLAEDPETVQKVVTAIAKAAQWMQSASAEEIAKALEPLFEGRYDELLYTAQVDKDSKLLSATGYHTPSGYAAALSLTALSGGIPSTDIPAAQIYDESFLDKAQTALTP